MKTKNPILLTALILFTAVITTSCSQPSSQQSNTTETDTQTSNTPTAPATNTANSSANQNSGKIELRLRLKEGDVFRTKMLTTQKVTQELQGASDSSESSLEAVTRFDVEALSEDGKMSLINKYESVHSISKGSSGNTDYNSEDPETPIGPEAMMWQAVMANPITMVMTATGQVEDVKGIDTLINRVLDGYPPATRKLMEPTMRNSFGDQFFKDQMKNYFIVYPDEPVGIGDSWEHEMVISSGVPLIMKSKMTLTKREGGVATVHIESTISANPDAKPIEVGPIVVSYYDMTGTQQGDFEIDESNGWIKKGSLKQSFTGTMEMTIEQLGFSDSNIPVHGETEMTFETRAAE